MRMERWALRAVALWSVKLHGGCGGGGREGEETTKEEVTKEQTEFNFQT